MTKLARMVEEAEKRADEQHKGELVFWNSPDGWRVAWGVLHAENFWLEQPCFSTLENALEWLLNESPHAALGYRR